MSVSFEVQGEIAVIKIDSPPVNASSQAVRQGLMDALDQAMADRAVKGIILFFAGNSFIGDADIKEFDKAPLNPALTEVIERIENCQVPTLAAIDGAALGGGLEVTLACRYRIAAYSAKLGTSEVNSGLIPEGGSRQTLPRLIGKVKAAEMIATGRPVTAEQALVDGLIDRIAFEDCLKTAKSFMNKIVSG